MRIGFAWAVMAATIAAATVWTASPAAAAAPGDGIFTVAGSGIAGFCCDGASARVVDMNHPRGLAVLPDGGFLVAEAFGHRVRRVYPDGTARTVAGTGVGGFSGDGGPATSAKLQQPHAVVALADGGFLVADTNNFRIRRVLPDGRIITVAGTGVKGYVGDGGSATNARISAARGLEGTPDGAFLIADTDNHRVRRVNLSGVITTVAGTGVAGYSGDGGPAAQARINKPFGVAVMSDGGYLITSNGDHRIRRVAPDGTITTVAGTGVAGYAGDGGPATSARLNSPHNVTPLADGTILIADSLNQRIRQVTTAGTIQTFAGTGVAGFTGEGAAPTAAGLFNPKAVTPFADGVLVADASDQRVRFVGATSWPVPTAPQGLASIDGNVAYTRSPLVTVAVPATDAATVRLSNSPSTSSGVLSQGTWLPYSDAVGWDLSDPATGGTAGDGRKLVYVQWQDSSGTWSSVVTDSIVVDSMAPVVTAPAPVLTAGTTLSSSGVPATIPWTATDTTSGLARTALQKSVDGGAFTNVTLASATATSVAVRLTPGRTYTYQSAATDRSGNTSAWMPGPTFSVSLVEDTSPLVAFAGAWTQTALATASGGTLTSSKTPDDTATMSFEGAAIAWVAPATPYRGAAEVSIDGQLISTVNLYNPQAVNQRLDFVRAWPINGTHDIQVRNLATAGRPRIDIDAFVVLRYTP